jgi:predicted RNA binding protein YcfA (HicA-like mRNA interferase family)
MRQKGSHLIMEHDSKQTQLVVPYHQAKEIPIGTLRSILKKAGIDTDKR